DLAHAFSGNHLSPESQNISAVVLAAVARGCLVITHRGSHPGHLVGCHTRSDSSSVNDYPKIARLGGDSPRYKMRVVRIVNGFSRVRAEILMIVTKISQQTLDLLFHLEAAMIGAESDLFLVRGAATTDSFELNASFADQVLSERSQQRGLVNSQRITRGGLANFVLGDYLFASFIDDAHKNLDSR